MNTKDGYVFTVDQVGISNVNITNLNTNFTVQSNEDGRFVIPYNSLSDTLRFTHVGYKPLIISINNYNNSYVELEESIESLEEVAVIGNGKPKKDNTLLWLLGGVLVAIVGYNVLKSKPTRVKV